MYYSVNNCIIGTDANEYDSKTLVVGCISSVIPSDGSVTTIGDEAFLNCIGLDTLDIPEGVTTIAYAAFKYCELKSIIIPASMTKIGADVFMNSNSPLETVYYRGSEEQWKQIEISDGTNEVFTNAKIVYDYKG